MTGPSVRAGVDATARDLLVREPYYGHLLVGTLRTVTGGDFGVRLVPTGVAPGLEIAARAWTAMSPAARVASLKHELLHLSLKHPLRAQAYSSPELWGLACDLVVNQFMDTADLPGAITRLELGLPPDRSADEYYGLLRETYTVACGAPGAPDPVVDTIQRWLDGPGAARHRSWAMFAGLSSATLSIYDANVDALVATTVRRSRLRGWGRLPGALIELLETVTQEPEVPWRRVLRLFGATSERTYVKNSLTRRSKRYGTSPGIKIRRRTRLVVAVDTSGSVSGPEITMFFTEIHGMWRRGVDITVLEADAAVEVEYPYRGQPPGSAAGRGGTDFGPAIARANQLTPDGLVYLTDGCAPAPRVPARMPVLWVLTAQGAPDDLSHLPGRRIRLTRPRGAAA